MSIKSFALLTLAAATIAFGSVPARAAVNTEAPTAGSTTGATHEPAMERCGCQRYVRYRIVRPYVRVYRINYRYVRFVRVRYI